MLMDGSPLINNISHSNLALKSARFAQSNALVSQFTGSLPTQVSMIS
jgi:hypothetical protein